MYKEKSLIMLPTKESNLCSTINDNKLYLKQRFKLGKCFHLYITSDETPKKDDWVVGGFNNQFFGKVLGVSALKDTIIISGYEGQTLNISWCKKIIATSDESLVAKFGNDGEVYGKMKDGLLQIPKSFIKQFIEEYNKGNIITKVMVEYKEFLEMNDPTGKYTTYEIRINPDNTINIRAIKTSWSREEVRDILNDFFNDHTNCQNANIDKWLEENL